MININSQYKTIVGWGTSKYFEETIDLIPYNLTYLVDKNDKKWGTFQNGLEIFSPKKIEIENPEETLVIVFSTFYNEICEELKKMGFNYIISGYELVSVDEVLSKNELNSRKIIQEYEEKEKFITVSRNNFSLYLGGTSKFIREQMEIANSKGMVHFHFYWKQFNLKDFTGIYCFVIVNGEELAVFELEAFKKILKKVKTVVVHNIIELQQDILYEFLLNEFKDLNVYYYLHDFSCICKNIKLAYNDEFFCNGFEDNWQLCNSCRYKEEKEKIYNFHAEMFALNNVILVAPSENVKNAILKSFATIKNEIMIIPHQTYRVETLSKTPKRDSENIKVAYVGYKHKFKGWDSFKQLVAECHNQYDFYCLGFSDEIIPHVTHVEVSFIKDGETAMTKKLLEHEIDIALLWSEWPETYSYTYYESVAAGAYIITNDKSGNIKDQVHIYNNGVSLSKYEELKQLFEDEKKVRKLVVQNNVRFKELTKNVEGMSLVFN